MDSVTKFGISWDVSVIAGEMRGELRKGQGGGLVLVPRSFGIWSRSWMQAGHKDRFERARYVYLSVTVLLAIHDDSRAVEKKLRARLPGPSSPHSFSIVPI